MEKRKGHNRDVNWFKIENIRKKERRVYRCDMFSILWQYHINNGLFVLIAKKKQRTSVSGRKCKKRKKKKDKSV